MTGGEEGRKGAEVDWSYSILPLVLRPHHLSSTYAAGPAGIYHIHACLSPPFPLPPLPCLLCLDAFPLVVQRGWATSTYVHVPPPPPPPPSCLLVRSSVARSAAVAGGKETPLIAPFYFSLTALGGGGFRQWAISTKREGKRRNHTKIRAKYVSSDVVESLIYNTVVPLFLLRCIWIVDRTGACA